MSSDAFDTAPQWGPKMAALPNDKWRRFVMALYDPKAPKLGARVGGGLLNWAVEKAGFGETNNNSRSVKARQLKNDPRIKAAAAEYSRSVFAVELRPQTIRAVRELLADPKSKHHAKAIAAVLDRTDPIETVTHVKAQVEYTPPTPAMVADVMNRIDELAAKAGLPQLPPPIDVEAKEVPPEEE